MKHFIAILTLCFASTLYAQDAQFSHEKPSLVTGRFNFFFGRGAGENFTSGNCNILIGNDAGLHLGPGTNYAFQVDDTVTYFRSDDGILYTPRAALRYSISRWHSEMDAACLRNYQRALRVMTEHRGGTYHQPSVSPFLISQTQSPHP